MFWVLYHLKRAGFTEKELAKTYRICILPVLDYCAPVYHSLLTDLQDQPLEGLQASALRCIYGYDVPYSLMRVKAKVTTLRSRRIEAVDKFAKKCLSVPRFAEWFPYRRTGRTGNRGGEVFLEELARCNRLRDSPIFYMRRRLNGKPGREYGQRNKDYRDAPGAGPTDGRLSTRMNPARKTKI